ncbi:MAG: DUF368 domain-containing protein [Candidatus Woesearchaeota archaeon]|nr:DUF368 domain-containing protein [Candidatus Woesearchaeota archaeon]
MQALMLFLKGLLMGTADIVPGVSGGTIAFITGIYERLINGLKDIIDALRTFKLKKIDWAFFVPLGVGVLVALGIGSHVIPGLITAYPSPVYSFFVGLILASAIVVYRHIKTHTLHGFIFGFIGLLLGVGITLLPEQVTTPSLWFIFLLGMIAICAMLLPGISGSYVLVMFGQYEFILTAVKEMNLLYVVTFILGIGVGVLSFARVVSYLLKKHHDYTFFTLTGLMLGALLGPVQIAMDTQHVHGPLLIAAAGFLLVFAVEHIAKKK